MISLAVDIGRATVAGIDVKGVSGTFKLDPDGLTFDKVRIADLADAAFNLNGRMEGALDAPRGTVTFDVDARGLDGTMAVLDRYWPQAAAPLRHAAGRITPLKAQVTLGIEPVSSTQPGGSSKVDLPHRYQTFSVIKAEPATTSVRFREPSSCTRVRGQRKSAAVRRPATPAVNTRSPTMSGVAYGPFPISGASLWKVMGVVYSQSVFPSSAFAASTTSWRGLPYIV